MSNIERPGLQAEPVRTTRNLLNIVEMSRDLPQTVRSAGVHFHLFNNKRDWQQICFKRLRSHRIAD